MARLLDQWRLTKACVCYFTLALLIWQWTPAEAWRRFQWARREKALGASQEREAA